MRKLSLFIILLGLLEPVSLRAQHVEPIAFGDFEHWVTREIKESALLGGKTKTVYAIAPTQYIKGNKAYRNMGGSPWASSNVMANVMGIVKTSNTVRPEKRQDGGTCACMETVIEDCRVLGMMNLHVLVSGSIFLGEANEPIRSTSNPYGKMEMGIPFTKRPVRLIFDYKYKASPDDFRTESTGFSSRKQLAGRDSAEVYILLQHRWEDEDGNVYARRVGTGRERYIKSTPDWVNGHSVPIHYGDITDKPFYKSYMGLIPEDKSYYCRNSKGDMVPVVEVGWGEADEPVTHMLVMASATCGTAYIGGLGNTFWIDNIALGY